MIGGRYSLILRSPKAHSEPRYAVSPALMVFENKMQQPTFANPPNGSWGIVKVQPTKSGSLLNPPNGSWGIVKVQPAAEAGL